MYNYIKGKLIHKDPARAVIDINGVGYEMMIPLSTFSKLEVGKEQKLFTYLYVKEDVLQLFGFIVPEDKELFLLLISVSGIGPSSALTMLSSLSGQEIKEAIAAENVALIKSIKGIGPKTAQRLILELKDKVKKTLGVDLKAITFESPASGSSIQMEALEALMALGFQKPAAEKSLQAVIKKYGSQLPVEELIKLALKN